MSPPSTLYSANVADPERPHRGMKQTADAASGKEAAAALNQRTGVAKRLQAIFDSTKGDPGIAESLAKTRDAAGNLARGFGDMAGPGWGAVNAPDDAPRADDQSSQPLPGDSSRMAKHLDGKRLAAAVAAAEPADRRATGPEAAGRDVAAKQVERRQIPKDERPRGRRCRQRRSGHPRQPAQRQKNLGRPRMRPRMRPKRRLRQNRLGPLAPLGTSSPDWESGSGRRPARGPTPGTGEDRHRLSRSGTQCRLGTQLSRR